MKKLNVWAVKNIRQSKLARVEIRAGGDLSRSEKKGRSAGGLEK